MNKKEFLEPLISFNAEPFHKREDVLTMGQFIDLLVEEEDYWQGEQNNTKLMITRLRKIFYDQWGWNSELIEGAKDIETRYVVEILDDAQNGSNPVDRYNGFKYEPKHRLVTYREDDRVYKNSRVGQVPEIVTKDHQEVILPSGYYCDVAHILAGLDAYNHPQVVTPLPHFLRIFKYVFPHVDSNVDIVTWLGDIASSCGNFLFNYLSDNHQPNSEKREQFEINKGAPGSDMIGNIDAFVIYRSYIVSDTKGMRFTDILKSYYFDENSARKKRFTFFCDEIGLKGWNGTRFENERIWLKFYEKHLRNNTCFQVFSLTDQKLDSVKLPLVIWLGAYRKVLKMDLSLQVLLDELKKQVVIENEIN